MMEAGTLYDEHEIDTTVTAVGVVHSSRYRRRRSDSSE